MILKSFTWPALMLATTLSLAAMACTRGVDPQASSAAADTTRAAAEHYGLTVEFGDVAFLGPTMAGGERRGKIPAGSHLDVSYVREFTSAGLASAPTALEIDYTIDGGPVQSVAVTNNFAPSDGRIGFSSGVDIPVTASRELQVWFKFTAADGTVGYDSQGGGNYVASILPSDAPVLRFAGPIAGVWAAPTVAGTLKAGSVFRIDYDYARAVALGMSDNNELQVEAYANYIDVSGRRIGTEPSLVQRGRLSSALTVPAGAKRVEVYFTEVQWSTVRYDSNLGRNFSFDVH